MLIQIKNRIWYLKIRYGILINQGESVAHSFILKMKEIPLIISNAKGSCGCTVPEWPRFLYHPDSNSIKVIFNSKGKKGTK